MVVKNSQKQYRKKKMELDIPVRHFPSEENTVVSHSVSPRQETEAGRVDAFLVDNVWEAEAGSSLGCRGWRPACSIVKEGKETVFC